MADPVASTSPPTGQKQASPKVKDAPVQKHDSLEVETGAPITKKTSVIGNLARGARNTARLPGQVITSAFGAVGRSLTAKAQARKHRTIMGNQPRSSAPEDVSSHPESRPKLQNPDALTVSASERLQTTTSNPDAENNIFSLAKAIDGRSPTTSPPASGAPGAIGRVGGFFFDMASMGAKVATDWAVSDAKSRVPENAKNYRPMMRPQGGAEVLLTIPGKQLCTEYTARRGMRLMATMPKQEGVERSLTFALEVLENTAGLSKDFHEDASALYECLKAAFGLEDQELEEKLARIKADATQSSLSLVFNLKAGKGFMAKDSDGLSDPYAIIELTDGDDLPNLREATLEDSSTVKVSHVEKGTLNPVWNQEWVFENVEPKKQNLSIAFWDSDDPAIAHTVGSVNGYSGFKRMLTDTKKTLLCANTIDDFLGWVQVDLENVPTQGANITLKMQQRSAGSHVAGTVEVGISWKTNTTVSQEDRDPARIQSLIVLYQTLANTLVQYEYDLRKDPKTGDWDGSVSPRVHEILLHARLKCGLTQVQRDVCDWNAAARVLLTPSQHTVHIDSAGLCHPKPPVMLRKKDGLLLLVRNFKQIVDLVEKGEQPNKDEPFQVLSQRLNDVLIDMISQSFSFYGRNREDIANLFTALTFLELVETFKKSDHCSWNLPQDHFMARVRPKFEFHLLERFEQVKSSLAKTDPKEYDGKAIVHAIKLCRYICSDLTCADTVFRSGAGEMRTMSSFFYETSCEQYDKLVTMHVKSMLSDRSNDGDKNDHGLGTLVFELYFELDRLFNQGFKGLISPLVVGDRVRVTGFHPAGTVRFVGKHHDNDSDQFGVELDEAIGDHNGTIAGEQYFECDAKRGLLVRPNVVRALIPKWKMPTKLRFYYFWFEDHIVRWINKSKICGEQWITASIEMEQARQVTCRVLHSASVVDTFSMISQIWEFWIKLDVVNWEMPTEALLLTAQVSSIIQGLIDFYCKTIDGKLRAVGFYDTEGQFDISGELCITLNNLQDVHTKLTEHAKKFASMANEILAAQELKEGKITPEPGLEIVFSKEWDRIRRRLVDRFMLILHHTKTEVLRRIDELAVNVVHEVSGEIEAHLEAALKPFDDEDKGMDPSDIEAAIDPLLDYLDDNLTTVARYTYVEVCEKIMKLLWDETLIDIKNIYLPDEKSLIRTGWQNIIMMMIVKPIYDFFHQNGDGLSAEDMQTTAYKTVNELKQLTASGTTFLISGYYRRIALQRPDGPTELGTLKVATTVSHTKNNKFMLTVEVLSGSSLIGMDRKGSSSDPYVIVEIWPDSASIASDQVIKTKCIKKTLNPEWNETFDFLIDKDIDTVSLALTIYDYETWSQPDPMGEVAIILDHMPRGERVEKDYPVTASCPVSDTSGPSGECESHKETQEAIDNVANHCRKARLVDDAEGVNEVGQSVSGLGAAKHTKPRFKINWDSLLVGSFIDSTSVFKMLELRGDHVKEAKEWFERQAETYKAQRKLTPTKWNSIFDFVPPGAIEIPPSPLAAMGDVRMTRPIDPDNTTPGGRAW